MVQSPRRTSRTPPRRTCQGACGETVCSKCYSKLIRLRCKAGIQGKALPQNSQGDQIEQGDKRPKRQRRDPAEGHPILTSTQLTNPDILVHQTHEQLRQRQDDELFGDFESETEAISSPASQTSSNKVTASSMPRTSTTPTTTNNHQQQTLITTSNEIP